MPVNGSTYRADAQRNYDQLLIAARQAFLKNGASVALETIAKQAGVGIGTLYRHFPNRESLLIAVYAKKIAKLTTGAADLAQTLSPDRALLAWLQRVAEFSLNYGGFESIVKMASFNEAAPIYQAGLKILIDAQKIQLVRRDISMGDILRLISGATIGMTKEDLERVDALVEVIVSGLKTTPDESQSFPKSHRPR